MTAGYYIFTGETLWKRTTNIKTSKVNVFVDLLCVELRHRHLVVLLEVHLESIGDLLLDLKLLVLRHLLRVLDLFVAVHLVLGVDVHGVAEDTFLDPAQLG